MAKKKKPPARPRQTRKKTERATPVSERQFRDMIRISPIPCALNDDAQNIVYLNPAFTKTFGYELKDIPHLSDWWPHAYPNEKYRLWVAENWKIRLDKAEANGSDFEPMELTIRCKNGSDKTVSASAIRLGKSFSVMHAVTLLDITELKTVQQNLHDRILELNEATEAGNVGFWTWDLQKNQVVYSAQWKRQIGYAEDEISNDFEEWRSRVHPDDVSSAVERVENFLAAPDGAFETEFRFRHRDGHYLWIYARSEVERDDEGRLLRLRGSHIDITLRKEAELRLQESEYKYGVLFENIGIPAVLTRLPEGTFAEINTAFTTAFGYTVAEVLGKTSDEIGLVTKEERAARIREFGQQPHVLNKEVIIRTKSGKRRNCLIALARVSIGGRQFIITTLQDITERIEAEKRRAALESQMLQSQKLQALGTLSGGIAHDFNNIVATILGYAQLASQAAETQGVALRSLDEITRAATRAKALVQQILAFSRQQPTKRRPTSLQHVISESEKQLRLRLPGPVVLNVVLPNEELVAAIDGLQIELVIFNLGLNAIQAIGGKAGRVEIRLETVVPGGELVLAHAQLATQQGKKCACITVKDNGPGINPETLERIFEPFFSTKPAGEGTGLGLSVAHGIVQSHDGILIARSTPGNGSEFVIFLPLTEAIEISEPASHTSAANARDLRILFLDDERSMVDLVKMYLDRDDIRVEGFTRASDALAKLQEHANDFDLFVTDYNMPGTSGIAVAESVRAITPSLPVVLFSGYVDKTIENQAAAAGIRSVLSKSAGLDQFCQDIVQLARKHR